MAHRLSIFALAVGLVVTSAATGQDGGFEIRAVDRVHLDDILTGRNGERRVELYLRAVTRYAEPVTGLRGVDLIVRDEQERVDPETLEIQTLAETGSGMACVLAIDTSRTMRGDPFDGARGAAIEFVRLLSPRDRVAVVTFAEDVRVPVSFMASRAEATTQLELLETDQRSLSTVLNDGVHKAIELIRLGENLPRRAFVIVFSDGKDSGSHRSMEQVIEFGRGSQIQAPVLVFSVGYARFGGEGLRVLEGLSAATGGDFLHAESPIQVTGFFSSTRRQMSDSLVIGYDGDLDGEEHTVEVTIEGKSDRRTAVYADIPANVWPWVAVGSLALVVIVLGVLAARGRSGGRLVFATGPLSGQSFSLKGPKTRVGALSDNDIVIGEDSVSRYHAAIHTRGKTAELEDLDSSNGTFVNGSRVRRRPLERGDRIRFADVEATYEQ